MKYVSSNIGSSISANKISDYLNSNKIAEKSNHLTVDNYLKMLENAFIVYKADRSDIRSKSLLKTLGKYYIADTGLRNIILGFRNIDEGHLLENVVYLELLRRGYKVNIGKTLEYEIDFIAENPDEIKYYQVTQSLKDDEVKIAKDGEILVKGPNVMLGYYKDKKATSESIKNGYFKTGDFGYKKGNVLYITGRKKNLIIRIFHQR